MIKKRLFILGLSLLLLFELMPTTAIAVNSDAGSKFIEPVNTYVEVPDGYIGIYSVSDLLAVDGEAYNNYILMTDLDLSQTPWVPLHFWGIFDGNGYAIKNLRIEAEIDATQTGNCYGFFASLRGTVKNLALIDVKTMISGETEDDISIGGVVGETGAFGAQIENCYATGKIDVSLNAASDSAVLSVGGLVGVVASDPSCCSSLANYATISVAVTGTAEEVCVGGAIGCRDDFTSNTVVECSTLLNCGSVTASCEAARLHMGGVVGRAETADFEKCSNMANLTASATRGYTYIGGIIGYAGRTNETKITKCCNAGDIHAVSRYTAGVGGILGGCRSGKPVDISNCYNAGDLSLNCTYKGPSGYAPKTNGIGGIIGEVATTADIVVNTSYHYGDISFEKKSDDPVISNGGMIGYAGYSANASIQDCYWKDSVSDALGTACDTCVISGGRTLNALNARVQETYSGFDFETIWQMDTEEYGLPVLRDAPVDEELDYVRQLTRFSLADADAETSDIINNAISNLLFQAQYRPTESRIPRDTMQFTGSFEVNRTWPAQNKDPYAYSITDNMLGKVKIEGSAGCMAYASFAVSYIYGTTGAGTTCWDRSAEGIKAFIHQWVDPGEHIRYKYSGSRHSIVFLGEAQGGEGFYYISYNGGSNPRKGITDHSLYVGYHSYEKFSQIVTTNLNVRDANGGSYYAGTAKSISDIRMKNGVTKTILRVACPVEAAITLGNETLDSRNISQVTSFGKVEYVDDEIMFTLEHNEDYELTINGTGEGVMTLVLEYYADDALMDTRTFVRIPVQSSAVIQAKQFDPLASFVLHTNADSATVEKTWGAEINETVCGASEDYSSDDNCAEGTLVVGAQLSQPTGIEKALICVAAYSDDGQLKCCEVKEATYTDGIYILTNLLMSNCDGSEQVQIMTLGIENYIPLLETFVVT